ncbi:hypothetical protein EJB05_44885 [Eragrostis curvula]|uniref:Uncharacterized protein n=1 Tax=Eragrostis curvula TaxID=38414 RepID=A0A5J9TIU7_9POAL|nr:hypothetical protein EJB05_44885 [Eragrostis curvula]
MSAPGYLLLGPSNVTGSTKDIIIEMVHGGDVGPAINVGRPEDIFFLKKNFCIAGRSTANTGSSTPPSLLQRVVPPTATRPSKVPLQPVSERMLPVKRGAVEPTSFPSDLCCDLDSDQDALSKLSDEVACRLSKAVVSVALCKGSSRTVLFACSGIAVDGSTILTSASLSVALDNATKRRDSVAIEIRHEGNVVIGTLENCVMELEVAVVSVTFALDCGVCFHSDVELLPDSKVIAVGRLVSDKLIGTSGRLAAFSAEGGEYVALSTCKLAEDLHGGALFDFSGNFVGMNLLSYVDGSVFLPRKILMERLEHLRASRERRIISELIKEFRSIFTSLLQFDDNLSRMHSAIIVFLKLLCLCYLRDKERSTGKKLKERHNRPPMMSQFGYSLGYPKPSLYMKNRGMILVNSFEEPFGDMYPKGVWAEFRKRVASNIFRNVVALASFNGGTRIFACTGFFTDFDDKCSTVLTSASLVRCPDDGNNIIEGLKIEVLLPNKQRREGNSLYYNVALISVKNFRAVRPAILENKSINLSSMLVAVGRCYESGILMATKGGLADRTGKLVCQIIDYSTCKITKAGIGGPLVDNDGNFIGMNFYDPAIGTVFLLCDDLCGILQYFKTKNEKYEKLDGTWEYVVRDGIGRTNSWLVPKPYWCDPQELVDLENEKNPTEEYERLLRASGIPYRCEAGVVVVLK